MQQLLYADEVRPFSDVVMPDAEVREPELKLAKQLIEQITSQTFDPTQYEDDVRKRIHDDIQRKVDGQDISTAEPTQEPARIIDLMEALKASLGKSDGGKSKKAPSAAAGAAESEDRRAPRRSTASQAEKAEPKRKSSKR
jgi:DNA end-binding protein Ku